jgi:hypothetical protein
VENPTVVDENCFVIPPLRGPRDDAAFSGKPFISGLTPAPELGRMFGVDHSPESADDEPEGAD